MSSAAQLCRLLACLSQSYNTASFWEDCKCWTHLGTVFIRELANICSLRKQCSPHAQVWDRRALGRGAKPAGVLVGHSEGLTHLDSKGDGRYLLSNSKDQTARLWDVRKVRAILTFCIYHLQIECYSMSCPAQRNQGTAVVHAADVKYSEGTCDCQRLTLRRACCQ